ADQRGDGRHSRQRAPDGGGAGGVQQGDQPPARRGRAVEPGGGAVQGVSGGGAMLVLTFQVGREALALDIRRVREVVPRVRLRPVSGAPAWLAGVFVYRGRVVPVLDLHRLAGGCECPLPLSSRTILVPHPPPGP